MPGPYQLMPRYDASGATLTLHDYDPNAHVQVRGQTAAKVTTIYTPTAIGKEVIGLFESMYNSSANPGAVGLGVDLDNSKWVAGQWDDSAAAKFILDTTDAQDAGANDFSLTGGSVNDGFIVGATQPFSLVAINIGTAASFGAGGQVAEDTYWNGSAWTTLSTIETASLTGTGMQYISFMPPFDWTAGGPAGTSFASGTYYIRHRTTTTAPTVVGSATTLNVYDVAVVAQDSLASGDTISYDETPIRFTPVNDKTREPLVVYFELPSPRNRVTLNGVEVSTANIT